MKHYAYTITLAAMEFGRQQMHVHMTECPTRRRAEERAEEMMHELGSPMDRLCNVTGPTFGAIQAADLDAAREDIKSRILF